MLFLDTFRTYARTRIASIATWIGIAGGAAFGAYLLATENFTRGMHWKAAVLVVTLTLAIPAIAAAIMSNTAGLVAWAISHLPEGEKRAATVAAILSGLAVIWYFFVFSRPYFFDSRDFLVSAFYAWVTWLGIIALSSAALATTKWVRAGFR